MDDPTKARKCSDCKHCIRTEQHTTISCAWEKAHLPPPVFRARLWGESAPRTEETFAENCPQYQAKD
jgi:hypothetical protein